MVEALWRVAQWGVERLGRGAGRAAEQPRRPQLQPGPTAWTRAARLPGSGALAVARRATVPAALARSRAGP